VTERRQPLQKRFPGKVVARAKIWWPGYSVGIEGPIEPALARLFVAVFVNPRNPEVLAKLDAISEELGQDAPSKSKVPDDKALRSKVSKARAAGKLGAR